MIMWFGHFRKEIADFEQQKAKELARIEEFKKEEMIYEVIMKLDFSLVSLKIFILIHIQ